jgi:hypothetical protein
MQHAKYDKPYRTVLMQTVVAGYILKTLVALYGEEHELNCFNSCFELPVYSILVYMCINNSHLYCLSFCLQPVGTNHSNAAGRGPAGVYCASNLVSFSKLNSYRLMTCMRHHMYIAYTLICYA